MADTQKTDDATHEGHALDEGPIWLAVARMAGPMVFGILAVKSVSLVDTLFIGQLGSDKLAAISFAYPVTTVVSGLALGLSAAASSLVSRAVGEDDGERASERALHTIILSLIVTGSIAFLGVFITTPLFALLGASAETLQHIESYMRIWFVAVPFLTMAMMGDFIVRATGNSLLPTILMCSSSLLNIGVTALLVFGLWGLPEMGMAGAALGTLIAQVATMFGAFWMLTFKTDIIRWKRPGLESLIPDWARAARVAIPAALGNMVHPFTLMVITAILATFSEDTVAAFGVAGQVQLISTIPLLALSSALSPIAGQNWGASKPERICKSLKFSYGLCVIWAAVIAVPLWALGEPLAALFNSDANIPSEAQSYLRIVPFSLFGYGMVICAAAAFNGMDRAKHALGFNVLRSLGLFLPLAYAGSLVAKTPGLYGGIAAANVVAGLVVGWYALRWIRKHRGEAGQENADAPREDSDSDWGELLPAE